MSNIIEKIKNGQYHIGDYELFGYMFKNNIFGFSIIDKNGDDIHGEYDMSTNEFIFLDASTLEEVEDLYSDETVKNELIKLSKNSELKDYWDDYVKSLSVEDATKLALLGKINKNGIIDITAMGPYIK